MQHALVAEPAAAGLLATTPPQPSAAAEPAEFVAHDGGRVTHRRTTATASRFDNERPVHERDLEPFALGVAARDQRRVPGVHRRRRLPAARALALRRLGQRCSARAGRRRSTGASATAPGARFSLHGDDARSDAPVCHVSYYEADAFARWADARLPTEAEWETLAREGDGTPQFLEVGTLRPARRRSHRPVRRRLGWTRSAYAPYPGFAPPPGALGEYNGKFMVNQMRAARRLVLHAARARARQLPQLLLPARALAGQRHSPGAGYWLAKNARSALVEVLFVFAECLRTERLAFRASCSRPRLFGQVLVTRVSSVAARPRVCFRFAECLRIAPGLPRVL